MAPIFQILANTKGGCIPLANSDSGAEPAQSSM
jgi:hypothetical protein